MKRISRPWSLSVLLLPLILRTRAMYLIRIPQAMDAGEQVRHFRNHRRYATAVGCSTGVV